MNAFASAVKSKVGHRIWDTAQNYLFVLPAVAIFCLFYIYPFVDLFALSMHEWDGIMPFREWAGLINFQELAADKTWWRSLWNAFYITLIALIFQNALAFALALACDREIKMKRFYRMVFFLPPVLSEVVVGIIWNWILNPTMQDGQYVGLLNHFLYSIGLPNLIHSWLSNPDTVLTTIAVVHCWKGFGWGFIMLLAGLQTIDRQLYEAAKVDGANAWDAFLNVTVPMMMPVLMVVIILTILGSMQVFVLIIGLVGQGLSGYTEVPVTEILGWMRKQSYGYASAQAICFGAILVLTSFTMKKLSDRVKQA